MNCFRCQGLMVKDHFYDFHGGFRESRTVGWRCLNCGCVNDSIIQEHRHPQQDQLEPRITAEPIGGHDEVSHGSESSIGEAA